MKIVILGTGSFAREVYDWVSHSGHEVVGFFSGKMSTLQTLREKPIFYNPEEIPKDVFWVVGSGSPFAMKDMADKVSPYIKGASAIVHPSCIIGTKVSIGDGSIVCPGSILTCDIRVGKSVAINLACTLGHDVVIGDYVHLSPNTSLSGYVKVGSCSELGTGVSVVPSIDICEKVVVGAGASVVKNIAVPGVYVGVPAKKRDA